MKIPQKFQIFDLPVVITDKDAVRLNSCLSGWPHLHNVLLKGVQEEDLKRMVVLELCDKQRMKILDRLLMRLSRVQRLKVHARVKKLLK